MVVRTTARSCGGGYFLVLSFCHSSFLILAVAHSTLLPQPRARLPGPAHPEPGCAHHSARTVQYGSSSGTDAAQHMSSSGKWQRRNFGRFALAIHVDFQLGPWLVVTPAQVR